MSSSPNNTKNINKTYEIRDGQSIELLKELHILTRDGKLNQDIRRKLKQVYHLYQFIEPLMNDIFVRQNNITLVDHGAGKSYLGFILYDLFVQVGKRIATIYGVETREELINKSHDLAHKLGFTNMYFENLSVADSINNDKIPSKVDIVTALHACDTATDDAIDFALHKNAEYIVLVPCCQAEVANILRKNKNKVDHTIHEIWRHPIHSREFGSHITNVLRCLRLEANGYSVTATELIGWEHSMKNELIIAKKKSMTNDKAKTSLENLIKLLGLDELNYRYQMKQG